MYNINQNYPILPNIVRYSLILSKCFWYKLIITIYIYFIISDEEFIFWQGEIKSVLLHIFMNVQYFLIFFRAKASLYLKPVRKWLTQHTKILDASYLLFATCHPVICYLLSDTHRYLSLETHSITLVIWHLFILANKLIPLAPVVHLALVSNKDKGTLKPSQD